MYSIASLTGTCVDSAGRGLYIRVLVISRETQSMRHRVSGSICGGKAHRIVGRAVDDAKFRKHVSQLGTFRRRAALVAARRPPRQTIVLRVAFHHQVIRAPSLEGVLFRIIVVVVAIVVSSSSAEYVPLHFLAKSMAMQIVSHAD